MSAVDHSTAAAAATTEPSTLNGTSATGEPASPFAPDATAAPGQPTTESAPMSTEPTVGEAKTTDAIASDEVKPDSTTLEPSKDDVKEDTPALAAATTATTEEKKPVEPITEGIIGYKAPGLLKLTFSKREFWLSDSAVTPQHMDMYLRGEKPDIAHGSVAWASQTGKGLLFFNKKGETNRSKPASVLPLYDASDLKKMHPHEFQFKLHNQMHSFKATSDAERDGWYTAIEKAIEMGKASKESVRESEGYKSEMAKLNRPNTMAGSSAVTAATKRNQSVPKKSEDVTAAEGAKRAGSSSSSSSDEDKAKKNKSRSTSRGMLNRLKGKKEEAETKKEIKKEDKAEAKEEKKEEKAEEKLEKDTDKTGVAVPMMAGGSALDAPSTADRAMGAPVEDKETEPSATSDAAATPVAATSSTTATEPTVAAEKPKNTKRNSIFGNFKQSWGSMKSPVKEKEQKDAELKPTVPPKDGVSETAPQIPEPATTAPSEPTIETPAVAQPAESIEPSVADPKAEVPKDTAAGTPGKEKSGFLSGFMGKRTRSVSPSAGAAPKPVEKDTPFATPAEEKAAPVESTPAATEPIASSSTTEPAVEKPTTVEEPKAAKEDRRSSGFLGNITRRASKAFKGTPMGANTTPKKENTPASGASESKVAEQQQHIKDEPTATETDNTNTIGDVTPASVSAGQPQTQGSAPVAASA